MFIYTIMVRFKKTMYWLGIMFLVILASAGIGIGGAVSVEPTSKKEDNSETNIELVESKLNNPESGKFR